MRPNVILLNGGSSSGKSSLARALQVALDGTWLRFSVDTLIEACPPGILAGEGLTFGTDGSVGVGARFTQIEECWMAGLATMARRGANLIIEDGFLSGPAAQERWRSALDDLEVAWVGVRLAPELARERERRRGDRPVGMAELQADSVHTGITYDVEVDTSIATPEELARVLARRLGLTTL